MPRELLRYPAGPVRIQTGIKNKVHAVRAKNNITHDFSDLFGKQGKDFLSSLSISEMYRMALNGYFLILDELEQQIRAVNKRIRDSVRDDEKGKLLMTIPGVGYYSALLIRGEIGDINRFPSANSSVLMLGLSPPLTAREILFSMGILPNKGQSG